MPDQGTARCDFIGGSVDDLWNSIEKIFQLPDHIRVLVCHDYGGIGTNRPMSWETTIGEEKESNVQIKIGTLKENFIQWRKQRDSQLGLPKLIIPSIQVNINGGYFPEKDSNGKHYLVNHPFYKQTAITFHRKFRSTFSEKSTHPMVFLPCPTSTNRKGTKKKTKKQPDQN
jgi:hypothetical protein